MAKFKKGDRVRHTVVDDEGVVTGRILSNGQIEVDWEGRSGVKGICGAAETNLARISRFKRGDLVYCLELIEEEPKGTKAELMSKLVHDCFSRMMKPLVVDEKEGDNKKEEERTMREYKVGDTVQLVSERPEHWNPMGEMDSFLGATVVITYISNFHFEFVGSNGWYFRVEDIKCLISTKEDKPVVLETFKGNGYVYSKLKSLSPWSVLEGGPCEDEFNNYVYHADDFYSDQPLEVILRECEEHDWMSWLIHHDYIRCDLIQEEYMPIKVGDKFNSRHDSEMMLCRVGQNTVVMIFLSGRTYASNIHGFEGETAIHHVKDANRITLDEFKEILGTDASYWERIYKSKH